MRLHHARQFGLKLVGLDWLWTASVGVHARHVLPYKDAEFVRPIIPALPFHLDVLADDVVTQQFFLLDIALQRVTVGAV